MEEGKRFAFLLTLEHDIGQTVVLGLDLRQIVLGQVVSAARVCRYRLNGKTVKTCICNTQHILSKIEVVRSERAARVVIEVRVALVHQRLNLGTMVS